LTGTSFAICRASATAEAFKEIEDDERVVEELIEENDNQCCRNELDYEKEADTCAEV